MTKNYHKHTEYTRCVDFKRIDFIAQSIRNHFNKKTNLKGFGSGKGNVTVPLAYLRYQMGAVMR